VPLDALERASTDVDSRLEIRLDASCPGGDAYAPSIPIQTYYTTLDLAPVTFHRVVRAA
jgi:hypothetical protein